MSMTFRTTTACLLVGLALGQGRATAGDPPPTLYRNATVFTGRTAEPDAAWFLVDGGRVADVGGGEVPARWRTARSVDLEGRFVCPGFVDAHIHLIDGGLALIGEDLADVTSPEQARAAVARAAARATEGWVMVRGVGMAAIGNQPPTHARMAAIAAPAGERPLLVMLKGGHHAYANPAALASLGIDAATPDPPGGTIARDDAGNPSGLLADAAAWNAARALELALPPAQIARAIDAGARLARAYGITSIGDNTFYPAHLAQYVRMIQAGAVHLRVSARSYGLEPSTRLTMKSQGTSKFSGPDPRIAYFGDKFFLDAGAGPAGSHGKSRSDDAVPAYSVAQLRAQMLFATPFGTAYHTQSRAGAERLVAARTGIQGRRRGSLPDVIDHCGRCGGDGLPARIKEAGLRITVLPGQLHDLPPYLREIGPDNRLLAFRELFDAGLEPALTSDWPFGAETNYASVPEGLNRIGLAPLSNVAVISGGKTPDGRKIAGAETRTISVGQALLGVTAYGAAAIGRDDVGRLAPGAWADFVVLPVSPFKVDPVRLYSVDPTAVYFAGTRVDAETADFDPAPFASRPSGYSISPIIGYDPVPGFLLGGAYFFYPYQAEGSLGSLQIYGSPAQLRARLEGEFIALHALGRLSPRVALRLDTLRDRYYGVGMTTNPDRYQTTDPRRVDASLGALISLGRSLQVGGHVVGGYLRDEAAASIATLGGGREGPVNGSLVGARVEIAHDDRDNIFATRFGGRRVLWTEADVVQGGAPSYRQRFGATVTQFFPLRAPDLILALRAEGGASAGDHAYATDFALGGGDLLRGYYSNRFRGQYYAAGSAEVRMPIIGPFSAVAFGDVGRVWIDSVGNTGALGRSAGVGLRFGLPPDRLIRLRFDFGFAPDQWGVFFKFNEAF
jgi:predicted amidohydrolase YtcJ